MAWSTTSRPANSPPPASAAARSGDPGSGPNRPRFTDDEAFRCLRAGDHQGFSRAVAGREVVDLTNCDFRGSDLRRADLSKVILRGAYLKDTDLRGVDLRALDLEGCSIHNAKIGGVYFPHNLLAAEIQMSHALGTRLRTTGPVAATTAEAS